MADSVKKRPTRMGVNSLADIIAWPGDKSDLFCEIGRFVYGYSQLEFDLQKIFRKKVGIDFEHDDFMTAGFDFAKLRTALVAASAIEEDGDADPVFKKLMGKCHDVNAVRIAAVHGQWNSTFGATAPSTSRAEA